MKITNTIFSFMLVAVTLADARSVRGLREKAMDEETVMAEPHLEDFDFLKVIGKGGFSTVIQVRRKYDGMLFAMKCLKKS